MQRLKYIVLLLLSFYKISAQEVEPVDLGVFEGEIKTLKGELEWQNSSSDTLLLSFWTANKALSFGEEAITALPDQRIRIPYSVIPGELSGKFRIAAKILNSNDVVLQEYLFIGRVLSPVEDVFVAYRNEFWPFRARNQVFNLKAGFMGDRLSDEFTLYNFGGKTIDLDTVSISPYYQVFFEPNIVPHGEFTRMRLTLLSDTTLAPGFVREVVSIKDEQDSTIFSIPVQFSLEYPPADHTQGNSPFFVTSDWDHDFKVMEVGEKDSVEIKLSNAGSAPLKMERIQSNCSCLNYTIDKAELKSGESATLKVVFDATGRLGYERKTLAIFSNDPRRPTAVITFKAHVK